MSAIYFINNGIEIWTELANDFKWCLTYTFTILGKSLLIKWAAAIAVIIKLIWVS